MAASPTSSRGIAGETEQIVVQTEDGQPLTDEEIAALLAQQKEIGAPEEGSAQIVDADGNVVSVTAEQLAAAGIDVNNMAELSEEQLSNLLQLANSTPTYASGAATGSKSGAVSSSFSVGSESTTESVQQDSSTSENGGPPGDLTMVLGEDGSLRLVEPNGTEFLLTAEHLTANGIDITNLTEDHVQTILQLAMDMEPVKTGINKKTSPSGKGTSTDPPPNKKMRVQTAGRTPIQQEDFDEDTYRLLEESGTEIPAGMTSPGREIRGSSTTKAEAALPTNRYRGRVSAASYSLIGQEVEVKKDGRIMLATIRYCRQGAGFKVQFEDGHFEWVSEDQIQIRDSSIKNRTDHESYTGETGTTAPGEKNAAAADTIPTLSPQQPRRMPPTIPGIRVSQPPTATRILEDGLGIILKIRDT